MDAKNQIVYLCSQTVKYFYSPRRNDSKNAEETTVKRKGNLDAGTRETREIKLEKRILVKLTAQGIKSTPPYVIDSQNVCLQQHDISVQLLFRGSPLTSTYIWLRPRDYACQGNRSMASLSRNSSASFA
ncbi:hypothetical protein TNIN_383141 [Trichonephila inaurata madagascariensis]|uniref:Uncharacterized protein n=1 Tax=Trichonephila inaurata madagascariensis TaxID=2747483 RepID=A0A8X6IZI0_9ARAC|nr:hypothetical protein TNIN_383141 [Trichonephila inaurata madagascariensis]